MILRHLLILLLDSLWFFHIIHASSFRPQSAALTPIENWGPSWMASSAQGTTVAISFPMRLHGKDVPAVLILIRSQLASGMENSDDDNETSKLTPASNNACIQLDGIKVVPVDPSQLTLADSSKRWTLLGSSALCCMTGLSSDVDYLTRRLQQHDENDSIVYDSAHVSPILQRVCALADMLRSATKWKGDRPFGVQALLVGPPRQRGAASLSLFTLDPSGGYRHWGVATAIGKAAPIVRKCLYENLLQETQVKTMETALRVSLNATMAATADNTNNLDSSSYQALITWYDNRRLCAAVIDRSELQGIQKSLLKARTDSGEGEHALS